MRDLETTRTKVLGGVRQSKTKDESVSPASQRKQIQGWADGNNGTVVKFTFDPTTSGGKSIFRRKGLGPWLTEPELIDAWDILVITKLDRGFRDTADYYKGRDWCVKHGKQLVILNQPDLDTTSASGRAMGGVSAVFAEFERDMAKERNKERYEEVVAQGHWPGGRVPFGKRYDPETRKLVPDIGKTRDILEAMVQMAVAGKSHGQIRQWLNDNKIGTNTRIHDDEGNRLSERKPWTTESVRVVLRSDATAELIGEARAAELRAALRSREQTHGERVGGHMLLRVAYCRNCRGPLYGHKPRKEYRCMKCGVYLSMPETEELVENLTLFVAGNLEYTEMKLVPGDDHQREIHGIERDIEALKRITGTDMVIKAKQIEIDHLRSLPFDPDHYEPVPMGITVTEHWDSLDAAGKGSFLRSSKVRIYIDRTGWNYSAGTLMSDEDAEERLLALPPRC